jgi:hypothetical protein
MKNICHQLARVQNWMIGVRPSTPPALPQYALNRRYVRKALVSPGLVIALCNSRAVGGSVVVHAGSLEVPHGRWAGAAVILLA